MPRRAPPTFWRRRSTGRTARRSSSAPTRCCPTPSLVLLLDMTTSVVETVASLADGAGSLRGVRARASRAARRAIPRRSLAGVRNAGSVFVGGSAVIGDYAAGATHVLPTGGLARSSGGLGLEMFMKPLQVVRATPAGAAAAARGRSARSPVPKACRSTPPPPSWRRRPGTPSPQGARAEARPSRRGTGRVVSDGRSATSLPPRAQGPTRSASRTTSRPTPGRRPSPRSRPATASARARC